MPTRLELELDDWLDPSVGGLTCDLSPRECGDTYEVDEETFSLEKITDKFPTPYFFTSPLRHVSIAEDGYILSLTQGGLDCRRAPDVSRFLFEPRNSLIIPASWPSIKLEFDPFRGELAPRHIVPSHFKTAIRRHGRNPRWS